MAKQILEQIQYDVIKSASQIEQEREARGKYNLLTVLRPTEWGEAKPVRESEK